MKTRVSQRDQDKLHQIIVDFGMAMRSANYAYIADRGEMTLKMQICFDKFRAWCDEHRNVCLSTVQN
jgi:hypothetical protein